MLYYICSDPYYICSDTYSRCSDTYYICSDLYSGRDMPRLYKLTCGDINTPVCGGYDSL